MYRINSSDIEKIEPVTFSEINMVENDIEEILRSNVDMICDEEESMLIVGRQVRNEKNGRSDLTAVDNEGNIVLIEIKRDLNDITSRREAFEFQAIRYAASYATIKTIDELVNKVYISYIEKYPEEFELGELTSYELGIRKLEEFLSINEADNEFNKKQRIILVASDFDEQTLSAVAWLNDNHVNISCFQLIPYKINDELFIDIEKVLPVAENDDYYLNLMTKSSISTKNKGKSATRRNLPRIDTLLEWGAVEPGDIIVAKDTDEEAELLGNGNVMADDGEKSLQLWLKSVYGWSSVQTYTFSIHKKTNKSLSEIREEYMDREKSINI